MYEVFCIDDFNNAFIVNDLLTSTPTISTDSIIPSYIAPNTTNTNTLYIPSIDTFITTSSISNVILNNISSTTQLDFVNKQSTIDIIYETIDDVKYSVTNYAYISSTISYMFDDKNLKLRGLCLLNSNWYESLNTNYQRCTMLDTEGQSITAASQPFPSKFVKNNDLIFMSTVGRGDVQDGLYCALLSSPNSFKCIYPYTAAEIDCINIHIAYDKLFVIFSDHMLVFTDISEATSIPSLVSSSSVQTIILSSIYSTQSDSKILSISETETLINLLQNKVYNKIKLNGEVECSTLTTTNNAFTFTKPVIVKTSTEAEWIYGYDLMAPNMSNGTNVILKFGKSGTNGNSASVGFQYNGADDVNNCIDLSLHGYNHLYKFYRNRADFTKPLSVTGMLAVANPGQGLLAVFSKPDAVSTNDMWISVGKAENSNDRAAYGYRHSTDGNTDKKNHAWIYVGEKFVTEYYQTNVNVNSDLMINTDSTGSEYPLQITRSSAIGANSNMRIMIGDNTARAVFGYGHNANNDPYAYLKLYNKTAEFVMYDNGAVMNTTLTFPTNNNIVMNHTISGTCTSTDYSGNTNIDDTHVVTAKALKEQLAALQSSILQTIYPVGALYINAYNISANPAAILGFGTRHNYQKITF